MEVNKEGLRIGILFGGIFLSFYALKKLSIEPLQDTSFKGDSSTLASRLVVSKLGDIDNEFLIKNPETCLQDRSIDH